MKTNQNKIKAAMYTILSYMVIVVPMLITLMILALPSLAMEYDACKEIMSWMGNGWWIVIITSEFMIVFPLGVWINTLLMDKVCEIENKQ